MNRINLDEEIQKWNSNENNRAIIIPKICLVKSFCGGFYITNNSHCKIVDDDDSFIKLNDFDLNDFYYDRNQWIWIDKKKIKKSSEERTKLNKFEIDKGDYFLIERRELVEFFRERQKISAISKEIEEKLKNKKFSDSDREYIFKENFLFYMESCRGGYCYCDHPICVPQCSDILTQVLFHVENCFEKAEDAENFKNVFLADFSRVNSGEKETNSNSHISSSEDSSQHPQISTSNQEKNVSSRIASINIQLTNDQITDTDQISQIIKEREKLQSDHPNSDLRKNLNKSQEKLFELDPIKARQTIIALIDEKVKMAQSQWGIISSREVMSKINQLKSGEIVDRDAIINAKNEIFQETEDKINEKKLSLSVNPHSKISLSSKYFYYLIFI